MATKGLKRVALYLRVNSDGQTTSNQRQALMRAGEPRGWDVVKVYEDAGISSAKGWRPGFDAAMRDAIRRHFDMLAVGSIDRLGRSTAIVAAALAGLDAAGVAIYADKEGMDTSTAHGRGMLQMSAVFAELERGLMRERVMAGLARAKAHPRAATRTIGRPMVGADVTAAVVARLAAGAGMLKVAKELGIGSGTVQRIRRQMDAVARG